MRAIKLDEGVSVYRATLRGQPVALKLTRHAGPLRRLRSRLGVAPADRHWSGAALLAAEGLCPAAPLVLLSQAGTDGRWDCLVSQWADGPTLLARMASARDGTLAPRRQRAIARAVGLHAGCLAAAGLTSRDHKPSNLVIRWPEGARWPEVIVVDCQGVSRVGGDRGRHALRMRASLVLEAIGTGVTPRRTHMARALRAFAAATACRLAGVPVGEVLRLPPQRERDALASLPRGHALAAWHRIAERIASHGDPTPRVDPLAPPPDRS